MKLHEEINRILEIMNIDEMAYPADFDMNHFRSINSFAGRIKYAREMLLGKVGAGTGRAVFRIDDEKVLKVALNAKGVAQNYAESEKYKQEYDIIARVFDVDSEDTWVEMELAKKITLSRFQQLNGVSLNELTKWLGYITGKVFYHPKHDAIPADLSENEFAEDLRSFAADYDYPVPGDFGKIDSYGEVLRNGVPTVVLVDFGFSSDTQDVYIASHEKVRQRAARRW